MSAIVQCRGFATGASQQRPMPCGSAEDAPQSLKFIEGTRVTSIPFCIDKEDAGGVVVNAASAVVKDATEFVYETIAEESPPPLTSIERGRISRPNPDKDEPDRWPVVSHLAYHVSCKVGNFPYAKENGKEILETVYVLANPTPGLIDYFNGVSGSNRPVTIFRLRTKRSQARNPTRGTVVFNLSPVASYTQRGLPDEFLDDVGTYVRCHPGEIDDEITSPDVEGLQVLHRLIATTKERRQRLNIVFLGEHACNFCQGLGISSTNTKVVETAPVGATLPVPGEFTRKVLRDGDKVKLVKRFFPLCARLDDNDWLTVFFGRHPARWVVKSVPKEERFAPMMALLDHKPLLDRVDDVLREAVTDGISKQTLQQILQLVPAAADSSESSPQPTAAAGAGAGGDDTSVSLSDVVNSLSDTHISEGITGTEDRE